jgi:hypothetical protein
MNADEIKSKIKDFIDNIIKDEDADTIKSPMHDVITAKSQAYVRGPETEAPAAEPSADPDVTPQSTPVPQ